MAVRRRKTVHALSVPLRLRRRISGALTLISPHHVEYSSSFLRLLESLTREIARLIQRADDEKRLPPAKLQASEEFLRMIVVHELAHLRERDHNRAFYQLCEHMQPGYAQLEFDLRLFLVWRAMPQPTVARE